MNKPLLKDLQELVDANIITADTARQITEYYQAKENAPSNKFNLVLGILGAILLGSGVILLVAHNWDVFNKLTKTILAFLPLVIAQAICVYAIVSKRENRVWQEGSATFLFFYSSRFHCHDKPDIPDKRQPRRISAHLAFSYHSAYLFT